MNKNLEDTLNEIKIIPMKIGKRKKVIIGISSILIISNGSLEYGAYLIDLNRKEITSLVYFSIDEMNNLKKLRIKLIKELKKQKFSKY